MLVRAGQLVEQRGLAAVLIAHEREGQRRPLRKRIAVSLCVVPAALAEARVLHLRGAARCAVAVASFGDLFRLDLFRVRQTQGQLVPVDLQFHGISHRRQLRDRHFRAGDHPHIQKMLTERSLAAYAYDSCAPSDFQFF